MSRADKVLTVPVILYGTAVPLLVPVMPGYDYNFMEVEDTIKKIEDVTKAVMKCRKGDNKLGPQELKDKLGDKLSMASLIIDFTNVCLDAKELLSKMHGHNFELRGKVADLSSSAMKKMAEEMRDNQSEIITEIDEMKKKVVTNNNNPADKKTFADIVGDNKTAFVLPMKQALKQIEEEDSRARKVVVHGLDIDHSIPHEQQEEKLQACAVNCLAEILSDEPDCDIVDLKFNFMGKIGNSGRAPPVLVTMKDSNEAHLVVKNAWRLSRVKELRRVYITPDLSKEDREKRKQLKEDLKKKIVEFPEQHWVIRQGAVSSKGKHTPSERLDSEDEGKEMDRSFCY